MELVEAFTLRLFGPMQVFVYGEPLAAMRSRKGKWLLALLALRAGQPASRMSVAGALWPDSELKTALANLYPVISELRRALGSQSHRLQTPNQGAIRLDLEGAIVDVTAFDAAISSGDFRRAVGLYNGPLLEDCDQEWLAQERRARQKACLGALAILAQHELTANRFASAIAYCERAVVVAPLGDAPRRDLMQALEASGDVNAALQVYREFAHALRAEGGGSPDTQTTDLYIRLRSDKHGREWPVAADQEKVGRIRGDFPHALTAFVGREDERLEVIANLRRHRLVTLTGPGGIGKTRLAQAVASDVAPDYGDGVWFLSFEAIREPDSVVSLTANTLGIKEKVGEPRLQSVLRSLRSRNLLLVFDNCEHLLEPIAQLCENLLRECGDLRILATSREAFGILGEKVLPVPALTTPDSTRLPTQKSTLLRALTAYEAVRLFVDRARLAKESFSLTHENAEVVARICTGLDGVPLAIELAAALTATMPIDSIAEHCGDTLTLIDGRSRVGSSRRQTLRSTLDWSYELLRPAEQKLLGELSVFSGGWSLEAVVGLFGEADRGSAVTQALAALVSKSLVMFDGKPEGGRYRMLEMIRQYASEKLRSGGRQVDVARSHMAWFLRFAESVEPEMSSPNQEQGLIKVEHEISNLRAALATTWEHDPDASLRLAGSLSRFWYIRGQFSEGRIALQKALAQSGSPAARAKALNGAALLAYSQSDFPAARAFATEALEMNRGLGERDGAARSLGMLANVASLAGELQTARTLYQEQLSMVRETGNTLLIATTLGNLGQVLFPLGDAVAAKQAMRESLDLRRQLNDSFGVASALNSLGQFAIAEAEPEEARIYLRESLEMARGLGDKRGMGFACIGLGTCALVVEDYETVREIQQDATTLFRELGDARGLASGLYNLAEADIQDGRCAEGRGHANECLRIAREIGDVHLEGYTLHLLGRAAYEEGDQHAAWALFKESLRLLAANADRHGAIPVLVDLARVLSPYDPYRAMQLLASSRSLFEDSGTRQSPYKRRRTEQLDRSLRETLGEVASEAWVTGSRLTWSETTEFALRMEILTGPS
jgi:predicted ATPase/DNA-binding SARP family transcriptional activator